MAENLSFSEVEFINLVEKENKPQWWNENVKITCGLAKCLFERVEYYTSVKGGSQEFVARKAFSTLDSSLLLGNKIANLKRKLFSLLDKNKYYE